MTSPSRPAPYRAKPLVHSTRVLVVDDDQAARHTLEGLLRAEGALVASAFDGVEALEFVVRTRPDLVLSDLHMPRMGGVELCARLHAIDPHLPVILVTAHGSTEEAVDGLRAGAADLLFKPLDLALVSRSVLRTLDRRALDLAHERLLETLEEVCRDAEQAAGEQEAFVEGVVAELARPLDEVLRCAEALGPRPGDTWRAEAADALQAATLRLRDQIGSIVHRVHVRRTALEFDQRLLIELGARRRTEGTAGGA